MLKAYTYTPQEAGLEKWPDGLLRLEGTQPVESAKDADVFIYPGASHELSALDIRRLPYFAARPERHVFFHCADHENLFDAPSIFIRCNTRNWYLKTDPNTISWPWPVEDFAECIDSSEGFKFDVSFHGWRWSKVRKESVDSVRASGLNSDIAEYPDFCGYIYDTPEGLRRREAYRKSLKESRMSLCPESIPGVFPYRLFEAMSAGRAPFLIGSDYVLPWAGIVPWDSLILTCHADQANEAGQIAKVLLDNITDSHLVETGLEARKWWESHLQRDKWPSLMTQAVERKLAS